VLLNKINKTIISLGLEVSFYYIYRERFIYNMDTVVNHKSRRNVSLCFLYNGNTHKFVKAELSANSCDTSKDLSAKKDYNRNFFNSPVPEKRADNNDY